MIDGYLGVIVDMGVSSPTDLRLEVGRRVGFKSGQVCKAIIFQGF